MTSPLERWAVLIGVNFYIRGDARRDARGAIIHYPCLNGCVNDVVLVSGFLKELDVPKDNILELAAANPDSCDEKVPKEARSKWPTHKNIVQPFKNVIQNARYDDLVYIHYSGHGA
jgi:hypothetical protein